MLKGQAIYHLSCRARRRAYQPRVNPGIALNILSTRLAAAIYVSCQHSSATHPLSIRPWISSKRLIYVILQRSSSSATNAGFARISPICWIYRFVWVTVVHGFWRHDYHVCLEFGGASKHVLTNAGSSRMVFKVKCSNNSLFKVRVGVNMKLREGYCRNETPKKHGSMVMLPRRSGGRVHRRPSLILLNWLFSKIYEPN